MVGGKQSVKVGYYVEAIDFISASFDEYMVDRLRVIARRVHGCVKYLQYRIPSEFDSNKARWEICEWWNGSVFNLLNEAEGINILKLQLATYPVDFFVVVTALHCFIVYTNESL